MIEVFLSIVYFHAWDADDQAWAVYKCAGFFPLHSPATGPPAFPLRHRNTVFFQLTCPARCSIRFHSRNR